VPRHFADIVALRTTGDLGVLASAWEGWTLRRGELWTPDNWGPITPGDIISIPIRMQQISLYERLFVAAAQEVTL
jgi:hypothetical protein